MSTAMNRKHRSMTHGVAVARFVFCLCVALPMPCHAAEALPFGVADALRQAAARDAEAFRAALRQAVAAAPDQKQAILRHALAAHPERAHGLRGALVAPRGARLPRRRRRRSPGGTVHYRAQQPPDRPRLAPPDGRLRDGRGRYHPSAGATPEVVHPFAAEVRAARECPLLWVDLQELLGAPSLLRDGHLRIAAFRAAHALGLLS